MSKEPAEPFYHPVISAIGGRKFLALLLVMFTQPVLLVLGYLPAGEYTIIITGIGGTYITGNAIASLSTAARTKTTFQRDEPSELGNVPSTDFQTQ